MGKIIKFAFRITHIDNIPHIRDCGIVRSDSPRRSPNFVSIGDRSIIDFRSKSDVKGYRIGNFIPFYFGPRSPMLYVIQHGYNGVARVCPENIVYCVVRIADLIAGDIDCVFTDGHAVSKLTKFYPKERLSDLNNIVRYDDVYSSVWSSEYDIDLKRRKEAEILLTNDLPPKFICGFVVYNETARLKLIKAGINPEMIIVNSNYYFKL